MRPGQLSAATTPSRTQQKSVFDYPVNEDGQVTDACFVPLEVECDLTAANMHYVVFN